VTIVCPQNSPRDMKMVEKNVDGIVCKGSHEGVEVVSPVTGAEQSPKAKNYATEVTNRQGWASVMDFQSLNDVSEGRI
jgi:hypothetical protein